MISGRGHLDGFIRVGLFLSRRYIQCPALIPAVGLFLRIGSFLVVLFLLKYRYLDLSRLNLVSICFAAIFSLPRVTGEYNNSRWNGPSLNFVVSI